MLLLLRPLARMPPLPPAPLGAQPRATPSLAPIVPPPPASPAITGVQPVPPSALEAFGRALFGCTPEAMARLSPQDRAKCPPLAQAPKPDQDLLEPPRSHAKDEALWAEEKAERDWMPYCTGAEQVAKCMMHQGMAERQRAEQARARITEERRRDQPPPPPVPLRLGPQAAP